MKIEFIRSHGEKSIACRYMPGQWPEESENGTESMMWNKWTFECQSGSNPSYNIFYWHLIDLWECWSHIQFELPLVPSLKIDLFSPSFQ